MAEQQPKPYLHPEQQRFLNGMRRPVAYIGGVPPAGVSPVLLAALNRPPIIEQIARVRAER